MFRARVSPAVATLFVVPMVPGAAMAAGPGSGGAAAPEKPVVQTLTCQDGQPGRCPRGSLLTVEGDGLTQIRRVVFLGRRGRSDDRSARPHSADGHRLLVAIPSGAHSGPIRVVSRYFGKSPASPRLAISAPALDAEPASGTVFVDGRRPAVFRYNAPPSTTGTVNLVRLDDGTTVQSWPISAGPEGTGEVRWRGLIGNQAAPVGRYAFQLSGTGTARAAQSTTAFALYDHIFPIRGKHDLGQSATNNFGGGRGHQGQDMFARCGTPLVAARGGKVLFTGSHARAGNYVVIQRSDGQSYVYMHMARPALVQARERVYTGQAIGEVGDTGRASGCHLHFELWTAPGWYKGGQAVDPLPELQRWDSWS